MSLQDSSQTTYILLHCNTTRHGQNLAFFLFVQPLKVKKNSVLLNGLQQALSSQKKTGFSVYSLTTVSIPDFTEVLYTLFFSFLPSQALLKLPRS